MEINAQDVINKLTDKIAKLEGEKAVLEVQVEVLQNQLQESPGLGDGPVDGELID